ncbi:MAG: DCC1-like thiol-disulfide oxidoreductase family protein [Rhabdochlamydiaceae bacterium]|nr:DCC1-like thiol-disulfide oxidoreductase family protein [Candidatus Amphrikana amoebophyrae]
MESAKVMIFYDSDCGFCHFFIRFLLYRLPKSKPFLFAPLWGKSFEKTIQKSMRSSLPDSVVAYELITQSILTKGKAIKLIFKLLDWPWKILYFILTCFPISIINFCYDLMAKARQRFFKPPKSNCPLVPTELKQFILD